MGREVGMTRAHSDRRHGVLTLRLVLLGTLAPGCADCSQSVPTNCQSNSECPAGFTCSLPDQLCVRVADASRADGSLADGARLDGERPDSRIDAATDRSAVTDAATDAALDASGLDHPVEVQITGFGANPDPVEWGASTTLTFGTSSASACTIDGQLVCSGGHCNNVAVTGFLPRATHTYELICQGNGGPVGRELVVTVNCSSPVVRSGTIEPVMTHSALSALYGGLGGCFSIDGNLVIADSEDIYDLTLLDGLVSVSGDLRLYNNLWLASLDGLQSLQTVGRDLQIGEYNSSLAEHQGNTVLASIAALSGLRDIGGSFEIDDFQTGRASPLTSVDGLQELRHVGGFVLIQYHENLASLAALRRLTTVGNAAPGAYAHYFWLDDLPALTSLDGLQRLTFVGGDLGIRWCGQLTTLAPLHGVTHIGTNLDIEGNDNLIALDLDPACEFGGPSFVVADNSQLPTQLAADLAQAWTGGDTSAYSIDISGNAP
jgi:hypothetical protein